ncbi:MAG: transporter substrate-binding domain-containing protein, partial [Actinomycetota bacterium]
RLDLEVEWVTANFETIFTAVAGGSQFDMVAAAVTATGPDGEKRDQVVDFSDFYFNSRTAMAVNTEETPDLASIDDLEAGDVVGVQAGTTGATYAEENVPEGVEIKTFPGAPAAFTDLEAGQVTAVVNDEQSTVGIIAERPSLAIVETYDTNEKYAFAFSPDNPELIEAVNIALAEIIADGTYEEIFAEYFPGQEVPEEFQASA